MSRGDATLAERTKIAEARKDNKAELERLQSVLAALPPYVPTDQTTLDAAQRAAATAKEQRVAECGNGAPAQRGSNCRAREADERTALEQLAGVTGAKASTDRVIELEAQIAAVKASLEAGEAVLNPNPLQSALEAMFGPTGAALTTWQSVIVAAVFELCLIACVIAFEVLGHAQSKPQPEVITARIVEEPAPPPAPLPRPRLVSSESRPAGSVASILDKVTRKARGQRVEIEDAFNAYRATCSVQGKRTVDFDKFAAQAQRFCKANGIEMVADEVTVYLKGLQLVDHPMSLGDKA